MGLRDLTIKDGRRMLVIGVDLMSGPDKPDLKTVVKAIRASAEPAPDARRSATYEPPELGAEQAALAAEALAKARELSKRAQAAIVTRYGPEYAIDLWTRITK